jgi:dihydroorotase
MFALGLVPNDAHTDHVNRWNAAHVVGQAYLGILDLPRNEATIELERAPWQPPASYAFGGEELVPFRAGEPVRWRLVGG